MRRICFFEKEKTARDITLYIKKSTSLKGERDLEQVIEAGEPTPRYITYRDIPVGVDITESTSAWSVLTPDSLPASSRNSTGMRSSPLSLPETGNATPVTSVSSSPAGNPVEGTDAQSFHPTSNLDCLPRPVQEPAEWPAYSDEDFLQPYDNFEPQYEDLPIDPSQVGPLNALGLFQPFFCPEPYNHQHQPTERFHSMVSATSPHTMANFDHGQSSWKIMQDALDSVMEDNKQCKQLSKRAHSARFSLRCISGCILRNQGHDKEAQSAFKEALSDFDSVLKHELQDSLSALANLLAILESYGQREVAKQILGSILHRLHGSLPQADPLTETVSFMHQTQYPKPGSSGVYDVDRLNIIHQQFTSRYGYQSKLALVALFNVAWAELEHKNYKQSRDILLQLKPTCEHVFGSLHLQAIMCAATLARAHLRCGEFETAQVLIEESVVGRVQKMFSETHPYYWEARHRQATFMIQWSDSEEHYVTQRQLRSQAEDILRKTVVWRLTVLGNNNPRTRFTFEALKAVLSKQGKTDDASKLDDWCFAACQQRQQDLYGHRFILTGNQTYPQE